MSADIMHVCDETVIFALFLSSLLAFVLYSVWHNWWENLFGRAMAGLLLGIPAALLRPVLYFLGVYTPGSTDFLAWLSTGMLACVTVGILCICWIIAGPHVRTGWERSRGWPHRRRHHHEASAIPTRMLLTVPLILAAASLGLHTMTVPAHASRRGQPVHQAERAPALPVR